jgi:beta-glucanase (GH16 family)
MLKPSASLYRIITSLMLLVCITQAGSFLHASDPVDPASAGAVPSVPEIAAQGYKLAFSDEFNGAALDETKWNYRIDSKGLSTELPANVTVSGGLLHLNVLKQDSRGKHYTGGGIISKTEFLHGYYEARFRIPAGKGWHTSFYTEHWNGKDTGVTKGREEIDICEQDSSSSPVSGYLYTFHDWGSKLLPKGVEVPAPKLPPGHAKPHNQHADLHDFHVWGMEFTPTVINFYFDGELHGSIDATLFTHTPMSIFLTTLGWAGPIDESKLPSAAEFDYIRYFTKPESSAP